MLWRCEGALVTIAAINFGKVVQFYSQFLNLVPQTHIPNQYAEFHLSGGLRLGVFHPQKDDADEFTAPAHPSISLCLEVDNLKAAIAHLQGLGYAPPGKIIDREHGQEVYAYDPAGNRLILLQKSS